MKKFVFIRSEVAEMSDAQNLTAAAAVDVPANKKTLKDVVLEDLEEKGKGRDAWLW